MLKIDCIHFYGDRPCNFHKNDGRKCDDCDEYEPINFKILIIKLDAIGDVLRTTSILPAVKRKYPDSHITWCTRTNARELFANNYFVNEVILFEDDAFFRINAEKYDIVINLDTSKVSSSIAASANGKNKIGFVLNKKGYVEATSKAADKWLAMSAFDDLKKENKQTYQEIMCEILELDKTKIAQPILKLSDADLENGKCLAKKWMLNKKRTTVGLNVGVGTKWPSKGWPAKRWEELIETLNSKNYQLLLFGGQDEKELITRLYRKYNFLINTGYNNSLVEFAAIVNLCDMLITSDTLALHIGTALNKKIIALFGPTSMSEIELFNRGIKVSVPDECKCYYNRYCTEEVSCMEKITTGMVMKAISEIEKL